MQKNENASFETHKTNRIFLLKSVVALQSDVNFKADYSYCLGLKLLIQRRNIRFCLLYKSKNLRLKVINNMLNFF